MASAEEPTTPGEEEEDFSAFRSPGGKESFVKPTADDPVTPKSPGGAKKEVGLSPHVPTNISQPKDIGGGYRELTQGYMESLVDAAGNPSTPCQLICAKTYKQLAKTILAVEGDDRKQLIVWALGHGDTGIKKFVKSSKAKETLAGLKLCELLMAQVGNDFAKEIVTTKWAERLYTKFYDTPEPILKMTVAQHISDWLEMFSTEIDCKPLRTVSKRIAKNALSNGGYGIPKPTAMAIKYASRAGAPKTRKSGNSTDAKPAASPAPKEAEEEVSDAPVRESPAPKAEPVAIDDAAAKRAEIISKCFSRYDLDKSGTINTVEEMEQLCTNLCFKLKIMLPPGLVEQKVTELPPEGEFDFNLGEFMVWFDEAFDQKNIKL